jgi:hypothetical protein
MPVHPKIQMLEDIGGGIVAFGQWVSLLCLLYDADGVIELTDPIRRFLASRLQTDDLDVFLRACAACDLIDKEMLTAGRIASNSVCEQLDYYRQKSEAGKKGNAKRWSDKKH